MTMTAGIVLCTALVYISLVGGKPTDSYDAPMPNYQPAAYAQPAYETYDVEKIVDYDYKVNDYYGNDHSKREHIGYDKAVGEYRTLLPNGDIEIVTYDSGPYGHFANVHTIKAVAPVYSAPAPVYSAPAPVYSAPAPVYSAPAPVYSAPVQTYAAPSYGDSYNNDYSDVKKIVDYDYAVNDYYGNEQTRQEHVEPELQVGTWTARMADGALESVDYQAGAYGNLAHVVIRKNDYAAPLQVYNAPQHSVYKRSVSYGVPAQSYAAPIQSYAAPVQTYAKVAPKMHYNYEEKNIYVPQTYAAPVQSYAKVAPKMHYNYEEKNVYVPQTYPSPQMYSAPQTYAPMHSY